MFSTEMRQLALLLCLLSIFVHRNDGATWNYGEHGPDVWSDSYPLCAGQFQSPINIRTACTAYQSFEPFRLASTYSSTENFTLTNNGHTVVGRFSGNSSTPRLLTGGGLNGTFEFLSFHLHWGENYKSGSEHQVNGEKYAGEMHFIHLNRQTNKYAVLGMFMKSSQPGLTNQTVFPTSNLTSKEWERYFDVAKNLQQENSSTILDLNLATLMGGSLNDFWRYSGSLTTPPCTEGIIWTIFRTPIAFTEVELDDFRKNLYFEDYRGPQPLFDRIVSRSFLNETVSAIPDYNYCSNSSSRQLFHQSAVLLLLLFKLFASIISVN